MGRTKTSKSSVPARSASTRPSTPSTASSTAVDVSTPATRQNPEPVVLSDSDNESGSDSDSDGNGDMDGIEDDDDDGVQAADAPTTTATTTTSVASASAAPVASSTSTRVGTPLNPLAVKLPILGSNEVYIVLNLETKEHEQVRMAHYSPAAGTKKSFCWRFFGFNIVLCKAVCLLCLVCGSTKEPRPYICELAFTSSTVTGTKGLTGHLESLHGVTQATIDEHERQTRKRKRASEQSTIEDSMKRVRVQSDRKLCSTALTRYVVATNTSYSAATSPAMRDLLTAFRGKEVGLVNRTTLAGYVLDTLAAKRKMLVEWLSSSEKIPAVSLAIDLGSDKDGSKYLVVTGTFMSPAMQMHTMVLDSHPVVGTTAEDISKLVRKTIEEYRIAGRVAGITTDNGANVVAACRLVTDVVPAHVRCVCHSLQLLIRAAFTDECVKLIEKVRNIVAAFRRSKMLAALLRFQTVGAREDATMAAQTAAQQQRQRSASASTSLVAPTTLSSAPTASSSAPTASSSAPTASSSALTFDREIEQEQDLASFMSSPADESAPIECGAAIARQLQPATIATILYPDLSATRATAALPAVEVRAMAAPPQPSATPAISLVSEGTEEASIIGIAAGGVARLGSVTARLQLDQDTRWDSTFTMLQSYARLCPAVTAVLRDSDEQQDLLLTDEENRHVATLVMLLEGFRKATTLFQADTSPTLSLVVPLAGKLRDVTKRFSAFAAQLELDLATEPALAFATAAAKLFDQATWANEALHRRACLLDPRYKSDVRFSEQEIEAFIAEIVHSIESGKVRVHGAPDPTPPAAQGASVSSPTTDSFGLWDLTRKSLSVADSAIVNGSDFLRQLSSCLGVDHPSPDRQQAGASAGAPGQQPRRPPLVSFVTDQVKAYLNEPAAAKDMDLLQYWSTRQTQYSALIPSVKRVLCVTASEASCERVFSLLAAAVQRHRASLSTEQRAALMFLKQNWTSCDELEKLFA